MAVLGAALLAVSSDAPILPRVHESEHCTLRFDARALADEDVTLAARSCDWQVERVRNAAWPFSPRFVRPLVWLRDPALPETRERSRFGNGTRASAWSGQIFTYWNAVRLEINALDHELVHVFVPWLPKPLADYPLLKEGVAVHVTSPPCDRPARRRRVAAGIRNGFLSDPLRVLRKSGWDATLTEYDMSAAVVDELRPAWGRRLRGWRRADVEHVMASWFARARQTTFTADDLRAVRSWTWAHRPTIRDVLWRGILAEYRLRRRDLSPAEMLVWLDRLDTHPDLRTRLRILMLRQAVLAGQVPRARALLQSMREASMHPDLVAVYQSILDSPDATMAVAALEETDCRRRLMLACALARQDPAAAGVLHLVLGLCQGVDAAGRQRGLECSTTFSPPSAVTTEESLELARILIRAGDLDAAEAVLARHAEAGGNCSAASEVESVRDFARFLRQVGHAPAQ